MNKYGGMDLSEAKRLRQLEEENRQLKHIVAEQAVDIRALEGGDRKKVVSPQMRRKAALVMQVEVEVSQRRRTTARAGRDSTAGFGYRRLQILLQRESW